VLHEQLLIRRSRGQMVAKSVTPERHPFILIGSVRMSTNPTSPELTPWGERSLPES
jgi:hypothetical protein